MIYMKSDKVVREKILELSKINKVGAAGTSNRGWLDALHWVIE